METTLPTPGQIALALIVVKSKPTDISLDEYFQQLREIIVDRSRKVPVDEQQYIDGTMYWKRACEKSEAENLQLRDKISELEIQLQKTSITPKATSKAELPGLTSGTQQSRVKDSVKANTQSKRKKVEATLCEDILAEELMINSNKFPVECRHLLGAVHRLTTGLASRASSVESLCRSIQHCSDTAVKCLKVTQSNSSLNVLPLPKCPTLEQVCCAIERIWRLILEATNQIHAKVKGDAEATYIPDIVYLFQSMLGQLQQFSLDEADRLEKLKARKGKRVTNASSRAKIENETRAKQQKKACTEIAITLSDMLESLLTSSHHHHILYKALMCALLDHVGSMISLMVFADPVVTDNSSPGLVPPRGLLGVAHIGTAVALSSSKIAAPYLSHILQRVVNVDCHFSECARCNDVESDHNLTVVSAFRSRLQKTLLRGIFGGQETLFNQAFERSFKSESAQREELEVSIHEAQQNSDWFVGQVWELLGWDILATKESEAGTETGQ